MHRLAALEKQLQDPKKFWLEKSKDDVVICYSKRTALTKAKRGLLKDAHPEIMLSLLIKDLVEQTKVPVDKIEDIIVGNVLQSGAGMYKVRLGQFLAGIPDTTPVQSVNRLCASGLEAINQLANKIISGQIELGIAGGVENMSMWDMQEMVRPEELSDEVFDNESARNCLLTMGLTSEKVAERYKISREAQDQFAFDSQQKAKIAQENGWFKDEILPIKLQIKDKQGNIKEVIIDKDEGIRDTSLQGLTKLKPAFGKTGKSTAGNSSQIVDGAAIALLARRDVAIKYNLPILARFAAYTVVGVPPDIMGVGPAFAIPKLLKKIQLTPDDIDIYEINEAFASQSIYSIQQAKLDIKKVNPAGGAISLGHPLGCTGARQVATIINGLKRQKGKFGVVSMCVGTGMGAAALIINEQQ